MEDEKYPYQKQWEEYRRRQNIFWLLFLAYIPFMILAGYLFGAIFSIFEIRGINVFIILFVFYAIVWSISGIRLHYWKCPRCGNSFHSKGNGFWGRNIFSGECLNCKLPKYNGSGFYDY